VPLPRVCETTRFYQCVTNVLFFMASGFISYCERFPRRAPLHGRQKFTYIITNTSFTPGYWPENILAIMQVSRKFERLVQAMAPSGNLFFLLSLQELRRQGLTFLAFYVLQRTIEERAFFEVWARRETGLDDYEVSRACSFLARSGLIEKKKYGADARVRVLTPTDRGVRVRDKILSTAAERLKEGVPRSGRLRRVSEAAQLLQEGNRILLGPLQLSFFDTDLIEKGASKSVRRKRTAGKPARGRPKRSEPS